MSVKKLVEGRLYLTMYGVVEYVGEASNEDSDVLKRYGYVEGLDYQKFKVLNRHGVVFIHDLNNIYYEYGFKFYRVVGDYISINHPLIDIETAEFIGDIDTQYTPLKQRDEAGIYFPYGIERRVLETIEYGTDTDPYSTHLYGIDQNDKPSHELIDTYFRGNAHKAEQFYAQFTDECNNNNLIGYSEDKDCLWRDRLENYRKEEEDREKNLQNKIETMRARQEELYQNLKELLADGGVTTFEKGAAWSKKIEGILDQYQSLGGDITAGVDYVHKELDPGYRMALNYLEETRQQMGNLCANTSDRITGLLGQLEHQQELRRSIVDKYMKLIEKEYWDLFNTPHNDIGSADKVQQKVDELERAWTDVLNTLNGYRTDVEQTLEYDLQRTHPHIFKAVYLDILHYNRARW